MNNLLTAVLAIVGGIITIAIVAVLVSPNAQTSQALEASGTFLARVIGAAVDPIATATTNGQPQNNSFGMPPMGGGAGAVAGSSMGDLITIWN